MYLYLVICVLRRCVGVLVEVWLVDVVSGTVRARAAFDPAV